MSLTRGFQRPVTLHLTLRPEDTRVSVKISRDGKRGKFRAKWVFRARLGNVPKPYQNLRMAWVWKLDSDELVLP